jgi:hypothetical protein
MGDRNNGRNNDEDDKKQKINNINSKAYTGKWIYLYVITRSRR